MVDNVQPYSQSQYYVDRSNIDMQSSYVAYRIKVDSQWLVTTILQYSVNLMILMTIIATNLSKPSSFFPYSINLFVWVTFLAIINFS